MYTDMHTYIYEYEYKYVHCTYMTFYIYIIIFLSALSKVVNNITPICKGLFQPSQRECAKETLQFTDHAHRSKIVVLGSVETKW